MSAKLVHLAPAHADLLSSLHSESAEMPWSADSFASLLRHRHRFGWLAQVGDVPAGYILVQAIAGEAEILSLAVRPPMQGRGIGRKLTERALDEVHKHGARRLLLEVAASNERAIALYNSLGFRPIGRRRAYYQRRGGLEDALVMSYVWSKPAAAAAIPGGQGLKD
jgi:[ribosomal protein S18]-alanine N-acetyltransferase